jgi:hypothetical protein
MFRNADKTAGSFYSSVYFPKTERRFGKQNIAYKFREEERDKLWLFFRISPLLGVMRHI